MHRAISRPWARGLLGCAMCFLLLQGAVSYTATTPTTEVEPSVSYDPSVSFGESKLNKQGVDGEDAVFFMEGITFPSDVTTATSGTLFKVGQNPGVFVGIKKGNFVAMAGSQDQPSLDAQGNIIHGRKTAAMITDKFPKDGAQHNVLVYVQVGDAGSIRVWIDCDEVGVGPGAGTGVITRWTNSNNDAYLLEPSTKGIDTSNEVQAAWPGGTTGAGSLHVYSKKKTPAAALFEPFTPYYFGCTNSCDASQTASCPNADCARDSVLSSTTCTCRTGFNGTGDDCTDIDECHVNSEAIADECHDESECVNTEGSFMCVCSIGFVGDGYKDCWKYSEEAAAGFNARTPAGDVASSKSFEPFSVTVDHKDFIKARADGDVVLFMQNITFPANPTIGYLFEFGGREQGLWAGINEKNEFEARVGDSRGWSQTGGAGFVTKDFPKDDAQHDVLVYVTVGSGNPGTDDDLVRGSIRVFIDCDEVGAGFTNGGGRITNGKWATGDNNAYLLMPGSNGGLIHRNKPQGPWSGGSAGAGPMHIYFKSDSATAPLFAPFTPYYFGCDSSCNGLQTASCDPNADCARTVFNAADSAVSAGPNNFICTCQIGFNGTGKHCTDIDECQVNSEAIADECHYMSECDNTEGSFMCVCPAGFVGEGFDQCFGNAWAVRTVFNVATLRRALTAEELEEIKYQYALIISADPALPRNSSLVSGMPMSFGAYRFGDSIVEILEEDAEGRLTLMALMLNKTEAEATVARLLDPSFDTAEWLVIGTVSDQPNVYRWAAQTTSAALEINPSGMQVDSIYFDPACMSSGCWRVQITYTAGTDDMNVIYLPKAEGNDALGYDFNYDVDDSTWGMSPADTYFPNQHPCSGTLDYDPSTGILPASVTSCCIPQFLDMYRPVSSFEDALGAVEGLLANFEQGCAPAAPSASPQRNRPLISSEVPILAKRGQAVDIGNNVFPRPEAPQPAVPGLGADIFADGVFSGMAESRINHTEVVDAYIGIYRAVLSLDEVELRRLAGQLKGTVGVEHTVDTFVGKAGFSLTGIPILDPFATQVAIHLEKTSFFSVSTHGTNDYTFLEYVNMRLVTILEEDKVFSGVSTGTGMSGDANGDDQAESRTVRTNTTGNVNYVQVTFTLGSKYTVNNNPIADKYESGLIPLDSVRAGRGTFFDTTTKEHVCQEYEEAEDISDNNQLVGLTAGRVAKGDFDDAVDQDCAPQTSMCASPSSIPDAFVSFNIPLGAEIFDDQASPDLSNNIFVEFVVNVLDPTATGTPNGGDDPRQMKTTLTASIPIVAGGINIFCDGFTAKTDLKDVANADIIVGTAASATELTRLRIIENVASTDLSEVNSTQIDTASIESALMTLVLRGNEGYFSTGASNTIGYSLELDDLITLHLMEDGDAGTVVGGVASNSKEATLIALLNEPADDNSDPTGLDTDGYKLNGAFRFAIARADGVAKLEPTPELLAVCPFNPPRPAPGNSELETCITRRDVRSRTYPARTGSDFPTAMEIFNSEVMDDESGKTVNTWVLADEEAALSAQVVAATSDPCPGTSNGDYSKASFADSGYACEAGFMTSILGDSVYARQLAKDFVGAIRSRYALNGRYMRAFWINPGYEWTPTQTAGQSLFQVSQKVYLFALITLDENWSPSSRRRMLLQADPTANSGSGTSGAKVEFPVTPRSMLATTFNVPEDKVAVFEVEVQLTRTEACSTSSSLQQTLQATMQDYLSTTASTFYTAQIMRMTVDLGDESCGARRALRKLLAGWSSATAKVQMLVVFAADEEAKFNEKAFTEMAGVNAITAGPNTAVTIDDNFKCVACNSGKGAQVPDGNGAQGSASSSSSDNTALIAGVCGGVGGLLLVAGGAALWMRSRQEDAVMAAPVQSINVNDLKSQLQAEV